MAHFMPPALLQLFTPRAALEFKNAPPRDPRPKIQGFADFVKCFTPADELPPIEKVETQKQKKERLKKKKMEEHKLILEEREKNCNFPPTLLVSEYILFVFQGIHTKI